LFDDQRLDHHAGVLRLSCLTLDRDTRRNMPERELSGMAGSWHSWLVPVPVMNCTRLLDNVA
jgi:hypothetical protein